MPFLIVVVFPKVLKPAHELPQEKWSSKRRPSGCPPKLSVTSGCSLWEAGSFGKEDKLLG
jgi:hypothetical protein